jgi:hypothetical protein
VSLNPDQQREIVEIFCSVLRQSQEPVIRVNAARFLGKLGDIRAVQCLLEALKVESNRDACLSIMLALDQIINVGQNRMTNTPENQPIFNIQQVGTINTGDMTIQGDQVGIQYNIEQNAELAQAVDEIKQILEDLQSKNPEFTQDLDILETEFIEIQQNNPPRWQQIQDWLSIIFAGGVEAVKIVFPPAGIPIEVAKRLYEIYNRENLE